MFNSSRATSEDEDEDDLPIPPALATSGCTYPTQKLVLAQYGFAAEAPLYGSAPWGKGGGSPGLAASGG